MRDLHRLPPLLHIMNIVGYVFPLAAIVLFVMSYIQAFSMSAADSDRLRLVALNLVLLSMVGLIVARVYKTRIYQPDRRPLPLDSWRSQARALLLLAAVPLCALVLAILLPPTLSIYGISFGVSGLGALILLGALFWTILGRQAIG